MKRKSNFPLLPALDARASLKLPQSNRCGNLRNLLPALDARASLKPQIAQAPAVLGRVLLPALDARASLKPQPEHAQIAGLLVTSRA